MRLSLFQSRAFLCVSLLAMAACMHFGVMQPDHAMMGFAALNTVPFAQNPELTAVAIGYSNTEDQLIADQVMPRVDTAETFKWTEYDTPQAYTVPDTKVGRLSQPNVVTFGGTERTGSVEDFGLDSPIPQRDMDVFAAMPKPEGGRGPIAPDALATMMLTNLVLLDREIRVANAVQASGNYEAANQRALAGADKWSDYVDSDPFADLMDALDTPLVRPNTLALSQTVWTRLRQNPKFVAQIRKNKDGAGSVTKQEVAEALEISKVLVGSSRVNTARKGQTASYVRTWGNHAALLHCSVMSAQTFQPTWGWTAQFGGRFAGTIVDAKTGLKGSVIVRAGEQVKEVIAAKGAGYLFQNVL